MMIFPQRKWTESRENLTSSWQMQVGYFLQRHALKSEFHSSSSNNRVNKYENLSLLVVEGWRD